MIRPSWIASSSGTADKPVCGMRCFLDAPDLGDVCAVLRVLDVARARQLVALLALLPPALAVALAGDHRVAAAFPADAAGGDHQVDGRHAVLDALGVMLDAAGVEQEAGLRRAPQSRPPARSSLPGTPAIFAAYSGV